MARFPKDVLVVPNVLGDCIETLPLNENLTLLALTLG